MPPQKKTGWFVCSIILMFLLLVSVLGNLVLIALTLGGGAETSLTVGHDYWQEMYMKGDTDTRTKIAVIYLTGIISTFTDGSSSEDGMVGDIADQLRQAVEDDHVKAIIIRINSPGGEVVASDSIYNAVVEARESSKKPIVASIDSVGASGAYYVAVGCNKIVATDMSITGSIGVIMETFNFAGLMEKVGVKSFTFKSGHFKDLLNPTREPTADEMQLIQSLVMEVYEKFVGIVATERKKDVDELKNGLADGRILSGKQAEKAGLVDELGDFDHAVNLAKELAGIKDQKAKVVRYFQPFTFRNLFRILGKSEPAKVKVEISPNQLHLETGKIYFLPPYMFQ